MTSISRNGVFILDEVTGPRFMAGLSGFTPKVAVQQAERRVRFQWRRYRNHLAHLPVLAALGVQTDGASLYRVALRIEIAKLRALRTQAVA